jgi:hypothetical protein
MSAALFPISRIAIRLGMTNRAVQLAVRNVKPSGVLEVRGQKSSGYSLDQFPARFIDQLNTTAKKCGYWNAEQLLANPPQRWFPQDKNGKAVPIADIAEQYVDRAKRLQSALAVSLQLKDRLDETAARAAALKCYRQHFGAAASERQWRRVVKQTIERDAGEERFDDITIYFAETISRNRVSADVIPVALTAADRTLLSALNAVAKQSAPTLAEVALIWTTYCEFVADSVAGGIKQARAQKRALLLIEKSGVAIARTPEALRRNSRRKYAQWWENGENFRALEDQRQKQFGKVGRRPAVDIKATGDYDQIVAQTVFNHGGRLADGVRCAREEGQLSSEFNAAYTTNPRRPAYVPKSVRRVCTPEVRRLTPIHRGPREHQLNSAYHEIDPHTWASGDFFSADDTTSPVYFYHFKEEGRPSVIRGQLLAAIDERSMCVLGLVLIAAPGYTSAHIYNLFTDVFTKFGMPRRGLILENGLWRRARFIKGKRDADKNGIADLGLRRLVGRIVHARLPRGKCIERVFGLLQDQMERLPGYSSRNERLIKNERFERLKRDVESGRVNPEAHLLNQEQLLDRYEEICEQYNDTPQQGKKLDGLTPRECWEKCQSIPPLARLDNRSLWLLSGDPRKYTIDQRHGIIIRNYPSLGTVRYVGQEAGARAGQQVLAWVNPRRPEVLCCTSLDTKEVFTLERYNPLDDRVDASNFEEEDAKLRAQNAYAPDRYRSLSNRLGSTSYAAVRTTPEVAWTGAQMRLQSETALARQRQSQQLKARIARRAQNAGISIARIRQTEEIPDALEDLAASKEAFKRKLQEERAQT